jgi:hypothetical protein
VGDDRLVRTSVRVVAVAGVLLAAGCRVSPAAQSPAQSASPGRTPTAHPTSTGTPATATSAAVGAGTGCHARPESGSALPAAAAVLPDPGCTPGVVHGSDLGDICPHVDPALEANRPGTGIKNQIYAEYGIGSRVSGQHEVDHLIPLELDGENDPRNLWPQPNDHPTGHNDHGYTVLNSKDLLEDHLHTLICAGTVP